MVSVRWVVAGAVVITAAAAATSYLRYFRTRPNHPQVSAQTSVESRPFRLRCDADRIVVDTTPPNVRAIEAQLYAQIVQLRYPEKTALVVESISIPVPFRVSDGRDEDFFRHLPGELKSWLAPGQRRHECSEQTLDRFPEGTILIPQGAAIKTGAQRVPRIDWTRFFERFPGAKALFAFSRAKLTSDGLDAVLYYDRFCPNLCGEGEWVWWHRSDVRGEWRVAGQAVSWIS